MSSVYPVRRHPRSETGRNPDGIASLLRMSEAGHRVNTPTVAAETVNGEVLMIHLESGNYYSLRASGATIWEAIELGVPAPAIAAAFRETYGVADADELVDGFFAELVSENLVAVGDRVDAPEPATAWAPTALDGDFVAPRLEKFTDMQRLILLDPVHEVDEGQGWPIPRSDA